MTKSILVRGGSWNNFPRNCRSTYRDGLHPVNRNGAIGFRVVCSPDKPPLDFVAIRGGSYSNTPLCCCSIFRSPTEPYDCYESWGFRAVCNAEP